MSRRFVAGACGLAAAAGLAFASPAAAEGGIDVQVLLAGNRIVTVSTTDPSAATADVTLTLSDGETLVGIDYRPANGRLYGVGRGASTTGLYIIDGASATRLATLNVGGTPLVLTGTSFGVDFNPVANALRIVSDTGQNLRVTPAGLGVTDPATGATVVDVALSGSGVSGAAYSNNDASAATATTQLFDIRSELTGGAATANVAYALLTQEQGKSHVARLVTVDLASGAATELGALGRFRAPIGMAVALDS